MDNGLLKLYVESTSLPLVHQMADFVACADDPAVTKLITWLRLPLPADRLAPWNAAYIPQMAAVSPAFVAKVVELARQRGFRRIELHSNHHHAWRGVAPLLRGLSPLLQSEQVALQLHLYDDGIVGPVQRAQHQALSDWPDRLARGAQALHAHVHDDQPLNWAPEHNHAWHLCWPTRYHWLCVDALQGTAEGRAWLAPLAAHVQPMAFDGLPGLTDAQSERYLELFGLDAETGEHLTGLAQTPGALLFTATGTWEKAWQQRMVQSQLRAIAQLRRHGCFEGAPVIAYKPHPANLAFDHLLADALSAEGATPVVTLPARVPLEVLLMAGLLPPAMVGVVSSFLCTAPPAMVGAVLCRRPGVDAAERPYIDFLLQAGLVQEQQLLPILDHD